MRKPDNLVSVRMNDRVHMLDIQRDQMPSPRVTKDTFVIFHVVSIIASMELFQTTGKDVYYSLINRR